MVCENSCCCGAFCRRLFCRARPTNSCDAEETVPFSLSQLGDARDVKFTQNLTEPLSIASHIICTGTPSDDLPWFAVNIGSGDSETTPVDIAVHFNVRLSQCYVVRNTKRRGKWGIEETTAYRLFPFKINRLFTIEILVDENETLLAVDGDHYCSYAHRNPSPFNATWVQVTGIRDAALKIQKTDIYPTLSSVPLEVPVKSDSNEIENNEPKWHPNVIATIAEGIPEGYQIVIHGRLRPMLHSFSIELLDAAREWPRPNVLLHVAVRAHAQPQLGRQLVALNARLGAWGQERRQRSARLVPGTETVLRVCRRGAVWSVSADSSVLGELECRGALAGERALRLRGDLSPERIYICLATSSPIREKTNPAV